MLRIGFILVPFKVLSQGVFPRMVISKAVLDKFCQVGLDNIEGGETLGDQGQI
jgi:hypothetical protein